ncbi:MAG: protocatechuate 3,4-dioxygenase subunit alpha [Granulosicoccus sp.]
MTQCLDVLEETASQTAGPYVHIGCIPTFAGIVGVYPEDLGLRAIEEGARGELISISGSVFDGTGWTVKDAMLESWQADSRGYFAGQPGADPKVNGFCRFAADGDSGKFTLRTVKPGLVGLRSGAMQAPHISVLIFARGINIGLHTRIYFDDEDNSQDWLLSRIDVGTRVDSLVARKTAAGEYHFDIHLQGEHETVFLDL